MKTIDECKANIQDFADKFGLTFTLEGECGFGRECIGLLWEESYVDFNPLAYPDYDYVEDFYDERLFDIAPERAYHKHNCLAVLERDDESIRQLSDWVDKLNALGATLQKFKTGATGLQVMFSGLERMAVKLPKGEDL